MLEDLKSSDQMVVDLRKGGHVIAFRHAQKANGGRAGHKCKRQGAPLTDIGMGQAEKIANKFRELDIKFGEINASAWCRTMKTASYFGKPKPDKRLLPNLGCSTASSGGTD